jgi:hypothetical protein
MVSVTIVSVSYTSVFNLSGTADPLPKIRTFSYIFIKYNIE